jgi:ureidoacrylate peracid hydrolase
MARRDAPPPSIHVNYPLIGNAVIEVDDFLAALAPPATTEQLVEAGTTVYGSDRGKIGTVEEVVPSRDGVPAYMVVPRGLVFDKDTFIPLDAVTHTVEDRVYVNVPKLVIGKLPWDERPTAEATQSKYGLPAARVDKLYRSHAPSGLPGHTA